MRLCTCSLTLSTHTKATPSALSPPHHMPLGSDSGCAFLNLLPNIGPIRVTANELLDPRQPTLVILAKLPTSWRRNKCHVLSLRTTRRHHLPAEDEGSSDSSATSKL